MRAHHDRLLIAALARQGVLQPAEVVHRVADRRGAVSGRPTGRGTPSSKAILSFAKQAFPVKNFWKDRETLKIEEIRLRSLTRGPRYDVPVRGLVSVESAVRLL